MQVIEEEKENHNNKKSDSNRESTTQSSDPSMDIKNISREERLPNFSLSHQYFSP